MDLEKAIEAAEAAWVDFVESAPDEAVWDNAELIEVAVRAAAPVIEQAALVAAAGRIEATFIAGARPDWLQPGFKFTASVIQEWAKRTVLEVNDGS
jgi:hypothetical protein